MIKDRKPRQYFVDLFCGGCNMTSAIRGKRIANDIDSELISLFVAIRNGWQPPKSVTELEYYTIKLNQDKYSPELKAFVKYNCSFGAKCWGGYAIGVKANGVPYDYTLQAYNHLMRQKATFTGVEFSANDYREATIPVNSIVYCDIPYEDTVLNGYSSIHFDHDYFWYWARLQSYRGHNVFVSSNKAPRGFAIVRDINLTNGIDRKSNTTRNEKLFYCTI
jgi:DNA adenine methylase